MQRVQLQPAYILHQRPYRDSSTIVDLLTPEFGRVSVLAKGVKRAKSRWQGLLRAFQPMLVSYCGRGELMTLTQVEMSGQHLRIPGNCLSSGLYMNELLIRLVQKFEPQIELFSDYDHAIRALAELSDTDESRQWRLQAILRIFEIKLLRNLGYEILFNTEADSGISIQLEAEYSYQIDYGPVRLDADFDTHVQHEAAKQGSPHDNVMAISGRTLLLMSRPEDLMALKDPQVFRESKRLMRLILANHLGGKPLLSRDLFLAKI